MSDCLKAHISKMVGLIYFNSGAQSPSDMPAPAKQEITELQTGIKLCAHAQFPWAAQHTTM